MSGPAKNAERSYHTDVIKRAVEFVTRDTHLLQGGRRAEHSSQTRQSAELGTESQKRGLGELTGNPGQVGKGKYGDVQNGSVHVLTGNEFGLLSGLRMPPYDLFSGNDFDRPNLTEFLTEIFCILLYHGRKVFMDSFSSVGKRQQTDSNH
jgi:hypothetical protein